MVDDWPLPINLWECEGSFLTLAFACSLQALGGFLREAQGREGVDGDERAAREARARLSTAARRGGPAEGDTGRGQVRIPPACVLDVFSSAPHNS